MKTRTLKPTLAKFIGTLFLVSASMYPALGQERVLVGRVIDIDGPRLYTNRLKDQSWYQAYMGMSTFLKEKLRTDNATQAVLQFTVGGRAGIGRNSHVEILTAVGDIEEVKSGRALKINSGTFWAKFDKQDEEFQIKTSGGVIGIEGTELLVGVDGETGETEVLLFEGQVRVTDNEGKEQVMLPGDYASFGGGGGAMCVLSYPAPSLRTLVVERYPKFSSFLASQNVTSIPKPASPTLIRGYNSKRDSLLTVLEKAQGMSGNSATGLQSDSASGPPSFSWSPVPGADSYALFVTGVDDEILFSSSVDSTGLSVPNGAPGLESGEYSWSVIPLDAKGAPLGPPAQSSFQTPGWTSAGLVIEEDA